MKYLFGHTSPDTAYVIDDYPYGFRLRCKMRHWIETTPKQGQRLVSQTTNPKVEGEVWNKPKKSTYDAVKVLALNEVNHIVTRSLNLYTGTEDDIISFVTDVGAENLTEYQLQTIKTLTAYDRAQKHLKWSITTPRDKPRQTREEQNEIIRRAMHHELVKM